MHSGSGLKKHPIVEFGYTKGCLVAIPLPIERTGGEPVMPMLDYKGHLTSAHNRLPCSIPQVA